CFGAIVAVHFLDVRLLEHFSRSLVPGGHLFIETFGGQGGTIWICRGPASCAAVLRATSSFRSTARRRSGPRRTAPLPSNSSGASDKWSQPQRHGLDTARFLGEGAPV